MMISCPLESNDNRWVVDWFIRMQQLKDPQTRTQNNNNNNRCKVTLSNCSRPIKYTDRLVDWLLVMSLWAVSISTTRVVEIDNVYILHRPNDNELSVLMNTTIYLGHHVGSRSRYHFMMGVVAQAITPSQDGPSLYPYTGVIDLNKRLRELKCKLSRLWEQVTVW